MYRGCRRLVCSLACVFSILFMLFLDTCTVKAEGFNDLIDGTVINNRTVPRSFTLQVAPTSSGIYKYVVNTNGTFTETGTYSSGSGIYRGSGTYTNTNTTVSYDNEYYMCHFKIPLAAFGQVSNFTLKDLYCYTIRYTDLACTVGSVQNACFTYNDSILCASNTTAYTTVFKQGYEFLNPNGDADWAGLSIYFEFDYVYYSGDYDTSDNDTISTTISFNSIINMWHVNTDATTQEIEVHDSISEEQLESISSTQEDTNTKITDFFGSFFDNLLHIFVPEDGYFSTWFDKVNTLLSDKLGMLYAPFDLVISTLQAIYSSSTTESGIPFPGIKWEDTWLVEPFTFTFASLGDSFNDLREKVYFATDTVLVFTFLLLLQSKVKLILEGHE